MREPDYDAHPLLLTPVMQMVGARPSPVLWVVGDNWIKCEVGEFYIDADEHVTYSYVRGLLLQTHGEAYQWDDLTL